MHDYTIFSKQELVEFLDKYDGASLYFADSPFDIMIAKKMEAVGKRIDANLDENQRLNDTYRAYKTIDDKWRFLSKSQELYEQWKRLDMEYERLSKLRFGR